MTSHLREQSTILQTTIEREQALLAPYAFHSSESQGRRYPEPVHSYRGPFQRDRDRILHSSAFRRLSGKMQVFTGEMGDYHRTRLTHTHEVASVARTMGRALRLNEDLVEALALFHDIGHPPFGHAGEDALAQCLSDEGGFSHNRHALTIAEELERRHVQYPGLNLSREVLDSQTTRIDKQSSQRRLLEARIVDEADSAAYDAHDTDDAVKLGLVTLDELEEITFVHQCAQQARQKFTNLDKQLLRKAIVHELIDRQVSDILHTSSIELESHDFRNASEASANAAVLGPSREMRALKSELESFL
jgi:dGTPase